MPMADSYLTTRDNLNAPATPPGDDSAGSVLADFGCSVLHSALQKPIDGVLEAFDHAAGTHTVQSATVFGAPDEAKPYSLRFNAQALGSAIGSLLPLALTYGLVRKFGGGVLENGEARGLLPGLVGTDANRLMLARTGLTGAIMDGVFNPIGVDHDNYWGSRLMHGLVGGAIYAGLGATSLGLRSAARLTALEPIAPLLNSRIGSNMAAGLIMSPVAAELGAWQNGRNATGDELLQSAYLMGLNGAALGALPAGRGVETNAGAAPESFWGTTRSSLNELHSALKQRGEMLAEGFDRALWRINPLRAQAEPAYATAYSAGRVGDGPMYSSPIENTSRDYTPSPPPRPYEETESTTARQYVTEPAPSKTYTLEQLFAQNPELEGHRTAFNLMRQQFPDDFRGLRTSRLEPLAHGGDSLVIDLAPGKFADDAGNAYSRAVFKLLVAPEEAQPGTAWQTPEWKAEWGRRDIDIPLLRLDRDAATTEPKELLIGGRRYYGFFQPKAEPYGGGGGGKFEDDNFSTLVNDEEYNAWERRMEAEGLRWLDKKPGQVGRYYMLEHDPENPEAPPRVVTRVGLLDYPSVGMPEESFDELGDRSYSARRSSEPSFDDYNPDEDEPAGERNSLSDQGMHILEAPPSDPVWAEIAQTVEDYKEGGVPRKDIEQTVGILFADYLQDNKLTAQQAVAQAFRQR
jgi:hypothetical protein